MGNGQSFQRNATDVAAEPEQEREYITVGFDGMGAQIALSGQVMGQEVGHVHGEDCVQLGDGIDPWSTSSKKGNPDGRPGGRS